MGIRWGDQNSVYSPMEVVRVFRDLDEAGELDRARFDHAHPQYYGPPGNKNITICARKLLGRKPLSYEEAWSTVYEAALGHRP